MTDSQPRPPQDGPPADGPPPPGAPGPGSASGSVPESMPESMPDPAPAAGEAPLELEPVEVASEAPASPEGGGAPTPPVRAGPGTLALLILFLALGLGLRIGHAVEVGPLSASWEADGFALTFTGRPWSALNRERPPGFGMLSAALARQLPVVSVDDARLLAIGLSFASWMAAVLCAAVLAGVTGLVRPSVLRAATWMAGVWAIHPTLVASSITPQPEVVLGGTACLLVAALAWVRARPHLLSVLAAVVAGGVFVTVGGVVAAAALVVGCVVYLLPVPAVGRALLVLVGLGAVLAAGWFVQRGPDAERPWLPDVVWARSFTALADIEPPHPNNIPSHVDLRARQALLQAKRGLLEREPLWLLRSFGDRLLADGLGPHRFERALTVLGLPEEDVEVDGSAPDGPGRAPYRLALGFFDLFLRGGCFLFALAVLGMLKRGGAPSCWPRAGAVVAALLWLVLLVLGAAGPWALAPFDVLLLGVAGAGVASTDPRRVWTRRLAFGLGGLLLCSFLYTAGWADRRLSPCVAKAGERFDKGQQLVALLADGGPAPGDEAFRAADIMSSWYAPLLRLPEPGYHYAQQALEVFAGSDRTDPCIELLVRLQVESLRFAEAAQLAEDFHATKGRDDKRSMILLEWVFDEERRAEGLPRQMP